MEKSSIWYVLIREAKLWKWGWDGWLQCVCWCWHSGWSGIRADWWQDITASSAGHESAELPESTGECLMCAYVYVQSPPYGCCHSSVSVGYPLLYETNFRFNWENMADYLLTACTLTLQVQVEAQVLWFKSKHLFFFRSSLSESSKGYVFFCIWR